MSDKAEIFYNQLRKAVETDQLKLPTLPEVAVKIRQAVDNDNNSAEQISDILSQDPALSARLLQLANSPLYRARCEIDNLQMAITRLGVRIVKDLVTTLAMRQVFHASSPALENHFRKLWETSTEVAAICRTLATTVPELETEQALIAGLIHNIGALPIIMLAEKDSQLLNDEQQLNAITWAIQNRVGGTILSFWNFPEPLVQVVSGWNDFTQQHDGPASYLDLVQVALLQSGKLNDQQLPDDWSTVPAFTKLGIEPDNSFIEHEHYKNQIEETRQSLVTV